MKKAIKLNIKKPCDQDFEKMDKVHGGRHCEKCKTQVVDFSVMSDDQLYQWLKYKKGNVCGRLREDQLNVLISEPYKPKKHFFLNRVMAALSFFISQTMFSNPQKQVPQIENNISIRNDECVEDDSLNKIPFINYDLSIKGTVLDKNGLKPINNIEIYYVEMDLHFFTDSNGNFEIILDTLSVLDNMTFIIKGEKYMDFQFYIESGNIPENLVFNMTKKNTRQAIYPGLVSGFMDMERVNNSGIYIDGKLIEVQTKDNTEHEDNKNKMRYWNQSKIWSGR